MTYRVLITGSRNWRSPKDVQVLRDALDAVLAEHPSLMVVHGGCSRGADRLAYWWVDERNLQGHDVRSEAHYPDWDRYGRAAGPIRNQEMVDSGIDLCLAFMRGKSTGTADCVRRAERAGIPVRRWTA